MSKNQLTKEEVYDVLQFANAMYNPYMSSMFTPDLLHQNLLNLNNNPMKPLADKVKEALNDVRYHEEELQGYNEWIEWNDRIYSKIIDYYVGLLSFDLVITCKNAGGSDYKSKEYKEDRKRVYKFLDAFDYKGEFRSVLRQILRRETVFTWLRTTEGVISNEPDLLVNNEQKNTKYRLQILPQKYCKLTGYFSHGLIGDIDMRYFLQPATSIEMYDPAFERYLWDTTQGNQDYTPYSKDSTFALWHKMSPDDGSFPFKGDISNFVSVPKFSSMMQDVLFDEAVRDLQNQKDIISAHALLMGEFEMMDSKKSGEVKDSFSVSPSTAGALLGMVRSGLSQSMQKSFKVGVVPMRNTSLYQYDDKNPDRYIGQLQSTSSKAVSASRLMFAVDKMSQTELENAIVTDYNLMSEIYTQFNNFLDFYINKKTRKFKFNFSFSGCSYPMIRETEAGNILDLADRGFVLNSSYFAKIVGCTPMEFDRALEEGHNDGMLDKLSQIVSIHTASSGGDMSKKHRRKRVSDSTIEGEGYE